MKYVVLVLKQIARARFGKEGIQKALHFRIAVDVTDGDRRPQGVFCCQGDHGSSQSLVDLSGVILVTDEIPGEPGGALPVGLQTQYTLPQLRVEFLAR